jgi:hypothetical protein
MTFLADLVAAVGGQRSVAAVDYPVATLEFSSDSHDLAMDFAHVVSEAILDISRLVEAARH